jgi:hypothetical protein
MFGSSAKGYIFKNFNAKENRPESGDEIVAEKKINPTHSQESCIFWKSPRVI